MTPKISKALSLGLLIVACTFNALGQKGYKAVKSKTLELKSSDGTNASALVWNADKKVYYSVIAGNETFPLETFNANGSLIFSGTAGIDTRGLWYNPKTKNLEGNAAGEVGYFKHTSTPAGESVGVEVVNSGQHQPEFNSVGTYNPKKKTIYFYQEGTVHAYKAKGAKPSKTIDLENISSNLYSINATSVIYTGRKGEELGVLDFEAKKVLLYNLKGKHTATVSLPEDAVTHDMFRFSFANGEIWLYDEDYRSWSAYSF